MSWTDVAALALVVVALLVWVVWVNASRLDRLHRKVGASGAVVDAQLVRRATVAAELATSGLLDPVSSVVVGESAWAALSREGSLSAGTAALPAELQALLGPLTVPTTPQAPGREQAESDLSAALRAAFDDPEEVAALRAEPGGAELLDELAASWYRVQLARRFHNEAVAQARRARSGWFVRTLRLAGRAPDPATLELDDTWPAPLEELATAGRP